MKIWQQDRTFFMGNSLFGQREMDIREKVAMKKGLYQKDAMRIVTTANNAEKSIDKNLDDIKGRVRMLQQENEEYNAKVKELNDMMAQAKEAYGIEDDSQEEKDLELLKKEYDIKKHGSMELLTDEEKSRLKEMGEPTDYQKLSMDLYKQADYWKTQIEENQEQVSGDGRAIRNIKIDRLKTHGMVDAQIAKDKMMEAAAKEAIGMLKDDAVEKLDEKAEEIKEAAEERKEKEEEKEERIEAAKEDAKEAEDMVEAVRENISELTESAVKGSDITREIEDEIKKIMAEEKLLEEDLKGLNVDTGV